MDSFRKWFYRPKKDDGSLLSQFFYADESLNAVACELDSFDGRQEPERCATLVNQLRHCQDKVLCICNQIMDQLIPDCRANRDFRVKFPDDVMQENLAGQLWFGAECLAAGSSIMNREAESSAMRPLAKALTKSLETVRSLLRDTALKGYALKITTEEPLEKLVESLKIFDRLFADFELCYVGAMVPVKSTKEYEQQELVCVLFSETLQRALERNLLNQADVDNYEPALMFTIPRLAIVSGLLAPPGGPLCLNSADTISEMFRPFRTLLLKIRELLWTLNNRELYMLEKLLCSNEEPAASISQTGRSSCQEVPDLEEFVHNFYTGYPNCKDFIADFYTVTKNNGNNMDEIANDAVLILEQENIIDKQIYIEEIRSENSNASEDFMERNPEETLMRIEPSQSPSVVHSLERSDSNTLSSQNSSTNSSSVAKTSPDNVQDISNPEISQMIENSENIEIPQTQYLLNQVSHENNINTVEPIHIQNSLPDLDAKKLISEANKTLANLLSDAECQNEISEQTDSGICTVISSENTSLYDKSPEEKKSFTNELQSSDHEEDIQENTSYSCSNMNSPTRKNSTVSENSCVCSMRGAKTVDGLSHSMEVSRISSNFDGSNEEIIGVAYGNGQIAVCDGNQPNFQINYSENWENLNLNIDASSSRKEFWSDLKCENCPSTSQSAEKLGGKIEKLALEKMAKRAKDEKQRRRHQRKYERKNHLKTGEKSRQRVPYTHAPTSTESSRSNSTDRCLNPRLANFGASLHPSQNTRQMPNFGSRSPHASPRLQHFDIRSTAFPGQRNGGSSNRTAKNVCPQNKKLLDCRRSKSEQIARLKRRDTAKSERHDKNGKVERHKKKPTNCDLQNDGLGPRTNKSGLVVTTSPPNSMREVCYREPCPRQYSGKNVKPSQANFTKCRVRTSSLDLSNNTNDAGSSDSCSNFCDSSSETSEFQSDCQDDEEIALAMQAAEIANRNQIRAKFRSSEDLVHRLFVCIAGVADQLQTNFASDLRNILKCVFLMNSSQTSDEDSKDEEQPSLITAEMPSLRENVEQRDSANEEEDDDQSLSADRGSPVTERGEECVERAPAWIPDTDAPRCMACQSGFTVVRRRHHCRNCGKVFCGRCSSNNVPLPRYGHTKPVRVCNRCFLYQVTPFTVSQVTPTS